MNPENAGKVFGLVKSDRYISILKIIITSKDTKSAKKIWKNLSYELEIENG